MPRHRLSPVPHAAWLLALSLSAQSASAQAPETEAEKKKKAEAAQLEKVVVTGIRATLELSLNEKRLSGANVDVINALEVGKMPDKNLADSLQRVVGVAVRTDYDEAEKVSMRGTNPDMSLILFNGHTVSGGDWYISDQLSSSRSTSLSLMPSSVLNQATVYKTSQANVLDGGLAGTINVTTRKPLAERQAFGAFASVGLVHATLPGKTSPQLNASANWKNEAGTLGLIGQVFKEKRYIRRDSASRFAYGTSSGWGEINTSTMLGITDASLAGSGYTAAQLNGVRLPGSMSTEFVEGVRDRKGGMLSAQLRISPELDVGATGFYSTMGSNNYGRLYSGAMYSMLLGKAQTTGGTGAADLNTNSNGARVYAQIKNPVIVQETTIYGHTLNVLKSADIVFPAGTTPQYIGNMEGFVRDGANASSGFFDLDATWKPNARTTIKGLVSTTKGIGRTNLDQGITYARYGTGVRYALRDVDEAPFMEYLGAGANVPVRNADGSGYQLISRGASSVKTVDSETSWAVDGSYEQDDGFLQSLDFGARRSDHRRNLYRWAPSLRSTTLTGPDPSTAVGFPADFGKDLGGGGFDNSGFYFPRQVVIDYIGTQFRSVSPAFDRRVAGEIEMKERQTAFYAQQNFEAGKWSGNLGLRLVRTEVDSMIATPISATICNKIEPGKPVVPCARFPTAINTAGDGTSYLEGVPFNPAQGTTYYKVPIERRFDHLLPSLNVRWEPAPNWIARFGASKTIGRQNYNIYGLGFTGQACGPTGCTVNGPNPDLQPLTAVNTDASLAWFYARRSLLQLSVFDSLMRNYPKTGPIRQDSVVQLIDPTSGDVTRTYFINTTSNQRARIRGWELSWEQPLWGGFGFTANASLASTRVEDGRPMVGASKKAGNLGLYFENDRFSVRLVTNYRGEYVMTTTAPSPIANSQGFSTINGQLMPTAPTIQAPVTSVALHANWNITKELQLSVSGTNLTNPARAQYRYSEAEPQKVDTSGRQYYLELRYKI